MLADKLALNLSGFFRNDVFPDPGVNQKEKRYMIITGLNYNILKWFSASINYVLRERDSNIDAYDYKDNRWIIRLMLKR
jgi:uncharacterized protein (PEP-CTERM system associated)